MQSMGPGGTKVGIAAGITAPITTWTLSAIVIASWPGYDPVSQSISSLVGAPLGWLLNVAFALGGLLGVAWAFGLASVLGSTSRDRAWVRGLLLVQAGLILGFAILPTDPGGSPTTLIGRLHLVDFYLYALTMPLILAVLAMVMRRDARWRAGVRPTVLAASLTVIAAILVPATVDGPLTPWLGLLERIYVAIPSIWQIGVGLAAWRLTAPSGGATSLGPRTE